MDDGYIKYRSERRNGVFATTPLFSDLNQFRTILFDLKLVGMYPNGVGYGNLSMRTGPNQFIVTASATGGFRTLRDNQYCLVEEFSIEQNWVRCKKLFDDWLDNDRVATPASIPYGTPEMAHAVSNLVQSLRSLPTMFAMAGHDEGMVAYGTNIATTQACLINEFQKSTTP